MYKVLIVGIGNLGFRYLEGILNSEICAELFLYDKSMMHVKNAIDKLKDISELKGNIKLIPCKTIDDIPYILDIGIITTTADVRFKITLQIFANRHTKYFLLEKVLFQKIQEYSDFATFLNKQKIKCWVNHPRRIYPFYQHLKQELESDRIISFIVKGGNWGLGCNGLHFIDLISYLTNSTSVSISTCALNQNIQESKRNGFVEFYGSLVGVVGGCEFILSSLDSNTATTIIINTDKRMIVILEGKGMVINIFYDNEKNNQIISNLKIIHFQSEIIGDLLRGILDNGGCDLPNFENASKLHQEFIKQLLDFYNKIIGDCTDTLKIT